MNNFVDLPLHYNMSPHFQLHEVIFSETASRLGIDNRLPESDFENAQLVCEEILEPAREYFNIAFSPSSFYRCPTLNTKVGGSRTSKHRYALAVDFEINTISNYQLALWLNKNVIFDKIVLENYTPGIPRSGWVHASICSGLKNCRRLVYSYVNGKYLQGLIK